MTIPMNEDYFKSSANQLRLNLQFRVKNTDAPATKTNEAAMLELAQEISMVRRALGLDQPKPIVVSQEQSSLNNEDLIEDDYHSIASDCSYASALSEIEDDYHSIASDCSYASALSEIEDDYHSIASDCSYASALSDNHVSEYSSLNNELDCVSCVSEYSTDPTSENNSFDEETDPLLSQEENNQLYGNFIKKVFNWFWPNVATSSASQGKYNEEQLINTQLTANSIRNR